MSGDATARASCINCCWINWPGSPGTGVLEPAPPSAARWRASTSGGGGPAGGLGTREVAAMAAAAAATRARACLEERLRERLVEEREAAHWRGLAGACRRCGVVGGAASWGRVLRRRAALAAERVLRWCARGKRQGARANADAGPTSGAQRGVRVRSFEDALARRPVRLRRRLHGGVVGRRDRLAREGLRTGRADGGADARAHENERPRNTRGVDAGDCTAACAATPLDLGVVQRLGSRGLAALGAVECPGSS
eukprot:15478521-Alexandrium_andersonii.AAC.1